MWWERTGDWAGWGMGGDGVQRTHSCRESRTSPGSPQGRRAQAGGSGSARGRARPSARRARLPCLSMQKRAKRPHLGRGQGQAGGGRGELPSCRGGPPGCIGEPRAFRGSRQAGGALSPNRVEGPCKPAGTPQERSPAAKMTSLLRSPAISATIALACASRIARTSPQCSAELLPPSHSGSLLTPPPCTGAPGPVGRKREILNFGAA